MSDLVPKLFSFVVLDTDGERLLAKYYDGRTIAQQQAHEVTLHKKTRLVTARAEVEVMLLEQELAVFRAGNDVKVCYVSSYVYVYVYVPYAGFR